jgi:hypothetical protein
LKDRNFAEISFNSFVDLNGDCRADLYITSEASGKYYEELYIKDATFGTYCLVENKELSSSLQSVKFIDMGIIFTVRFRWKNRQNLYIKKQEYLLSV